MYGPLPLLPPSSRSPLVGLILDRLPPPPSPPNGWRCRRRRGVCLRVCSPHFSPPPPSPSPSPLRLRYRASFSGGGGEDDIKSRRSQNLNGERLRRDEEHDVPNGKGVACPKKQVWVRPPSLRESRGRRCTIHSCPPLSHLHLYFLTIFSPSLFLFGPDEQP